MEKSLNRFRPRWRTDVVPLCRRLLSSALLFMASVAHARPAECVVPALLPVYQIPVPAQAGILLDDFSVRLDHPGARVGGVVRGVQFAATVRDVAVAELRRRNVPVSLGSDRRVCRPDPPMAIDRSVCLTSHCRPPDISEVNCGFDGHETAPEGARAIRVRVGLIPCDAGRVCFALDPELLDAYLRRNTQILVGPYPRGGLSYLVDPAPAPGTPPDRDNSMLRTLLPSPCDRLNDENATEVGLRVGEYLAARFLLR